MPEPREFPFLDSLIDEIWQGKRIVLSPPGTAAFVTTNVAFTIGAALWCAAVLPVLLRASVPEQGLVQLWGVALVVPQVVVPAVMVARGVVAGRRTQSFVLSAWLLLSAGSAVYFTLLQSGPRLAAWICVTILALARLAVATRSYLIFGVFQQRLRARRPHP